MKNTVLYLSAAFLLIFSTWSFGQKDIVLTQAPNHSQLDLFSAEILGLINLKMKEMNQFYVDTKLISEMDDADIMEVNIFYEIVLTGRISPANWEVLTFDETTFDTFLLSEKNESFEFGNPFHYTEDLNSNPLYHRLGVRNLLEEKYQSVIPLDDTNNWIDFDEKDWRFNEEMQYKSRSTSLGDWHFNLGPDENSYYFVPMLR